MGNMIEMTLEQAEKAVQKLNGRKFSSKGYNWTLEMEWDGWDLVFYTPSSISAMYHKNGALRNGNWVMKNRIAVNEKGKYVVSGHNARFFTKTRD